MKLIPHPEKKPFEKFSIEIETEEEAQELLLRFMPKAAEISNTYRGTNSECVNPALNQPTSKSMYNTIRAEMKRQNLTKFFDFFRQD